MSGVKEGKGGAFGRRSTLSLEAMPSEAFFSFSFVLQITAKASTDGGGLDAWWVEQRAEIDTAL